MVKGLIDQHDSFVCLDGLGRILYLKREWVTPEPHDYNQMVRLNQDVKI